MVSRQGDREYGTGPWPVDLAASNSLSAPRCRRTGVRPCRDGKYGQCSPAFLTSHMRSRRAHSNGRMLTWCQPIGLRRGRIIATRDCRCIGHDRNQPRARGCSVTEFHGIDTTIPPAARCSACHSYQPMYRIWFPGSDDYVQVFRFFCHGGCLHKYMTDKDQSAKRRLFSD